MDEFYWTATPVADHRLQLQVLRNANLWGEQEVGICFVIERYTNLYCLEDVSRYRRWGQDDFSVN